VQAQIAGARARTDIALAGYEQTVLRALEETENALVTHARSATASPTPRIPPGRV